MQISTRKLNSSGEWEGGFPYCSPVVWNRHNANKDFDDTTEPVPMSAWKDEFHNHDQDISTLLLS
jgi:hypothetical protein